MVDVLILVSSRQQFTHTHTHAHSIGTCTCMYCRSLPDVGRLPAIAVRQAIHCVLAKLFNTYIHTRTHDRPTRHQLLNALSLSLSYSLNLVHSFEWSHLGTRFWLGVSPGSLPMMVPLPDDDDDCNACTLYKCIDTHSLTHTMKRTVWCRGYTHTHTHQTILWQTFDDVLMDKKYVCIHCAPVAIVKKIAIIGADN